MECLKTRWVVSVWDYIDTFSPMAKHCSMQVFLAFAAIYDLQLYQLDIKNTFLHDSLTEDLYMEQLSSFVSQGGRCAYLEKHYMA